MLAIASFIDACLARRLPEATQRWLQDRCFEVAAAKDARPLRLAVSLVRRRIRPDAWQADAAEQRSAIGLRSGWQTAVWHLDELARARLLLAWPIDDHERWLAGLDAVIDHADLTEAVACYRSLPLLPRAESLVPRCRVGLRSNALAIFNATACDNPFPADHLDDEAWNQLVLKACFVGADLTRIVGLDVRANATLGRMLTDYVHERWAARRPVPSLLWRALLSADGAHAALLAEALEREQGTGRAAAALALYAHAGTRDRLPSELAAAIAAGELTWTAIAEEAAACN